jgi:hypothetical protein
MLAATMIRLAVLPCDDARDRTPFNLLRYSHVERPAERYRPGRIHTGLQCSGVAAGDARRRYARECHAAGAERPRSSPLLCYA